MTGLADRVELTVGPVAHGGHFVARGDDGRVVFVRHALPGERVVAEITEERAAYLRADAVEILTAAPERVEPPCRFAGPDRCGGCDFQHIDPVTQRDLKTAVVVEQLTRLARLSPPEIEALGVRVEPLPGGPLGWRTRLRFTVDATGRAGLLKHRSHEVVAVDDCVIATGAANAAGVPDESWPDDDAVEVVAGSSGDVTVTGVRAGRAPRRLVGPARVREMLGDREWSLDPAAFWQIHPYAAATFTQVAMEMLAPQPGETAWDLYGGTGVFAAALAARVGSSGQVTLVESDERAILAATAALSDLDNLTIVESAVERAGLAASGAPSASGLRRGAGLPHPDLVVLDPPRSGAGPRVVRMLVDAAPRAICYVACDPAALARDIATFRAAGWTLTQLRAFDAFPMTHHVECVALLRRL